MSRYLTESFREKLKQAVQAQSTKAAPAADLWISRPNTSLRYPIFLERQLITGGAAMTGASVSACHPISGRDSTRIYAAYIDNGEMKLVYTDTAEDIEKHIWIDTGFSAAADAVAVAFDGTMPKNVRGQVEFLTEYEPWVFWTAGGVLYTKKLNADGETTILATEHASAVTAVRAMWSEIGAFDFGLVVFYILAGDIYYRQYIAGEWTDAAPVIFGPDVTWVSLCASRTWDYRIALQCMDSDGVLYEMFTQYEGIGKQNVEHIHLISATPEGEIVKVNYTDTHTCERLNISEIVPYGSRAYALTARPVSVCNLDDGQGNWGTVITAVFDYPLRDVENNAAAFHLTDGDGINPSDLTAALSADGLTLTLTFPDFNVLEGKTCFLTYEPGSVMSPAVALAAFRFSFAPVNLVAPVIDPPAVLEVWNE